VQDQSDNAESVSDYLINSYIMTHEVGQSDGVDDSSRYHLQPFLQMTFYKNILQTSVWHAEVVEWSGHYLPQRLPATNLALTET
jgi:hypothetical protein